MYRCPAQLPVCIAVIGSCCEGEADTVDEAAVLVYRMACSLLPTAQQKISMDLNTADSTFLKQQDAFVAKVGDVGTNVALFKDLCLPATDADHLEFNLPLSEV